MSEDINSTTDAPENLRTGDIIAIANKHNQLDALLEYICLDDFQSFSRLRAGTQQNILRLARSTSLEIGELIPNQFN